MTITDEALILAITSLAKQLEDDVEKCNLARDDDVYKSLEDTIEEELATIAHLANMVLRRKEVRDDTRRTAQENP